MSLTRSGYKELGLKVTKPLKDDPRRTQQCHIAEEKKDEGVGDHMRKLRPREVDNQLTTSGPAKLLAFHLLGSCLRFLSIYDLC